MRFVRKTPVGCYTMGEVLRFSGATYAQVRAWDETGLLSPTPARVGRWRLYSRSDVLAVRIAADLRRLGLGWPLIRQALIALRGLELNAKSARRFLVVQGESAALVDGRALLAALQGSAGGIVVFALDGILAELAGDAA